MMRLPRAAALFCLAFAGCHDEDEISVVNAGGQAVLVAIEWDSGGGDGWNDGRRRRFLEVPAGGIYQDEFGHVSILEILITRKSDGAVLLAEEFDADDFDDDHGHIEIFVTP